MGRLSREKGLGLLVDAIGRAGADRPDLTLALVGDGPDRTALERELAGTRHRVLGPLRGDALAAAYASADVFCLPSETETFGQVVLEAAASGLPAVVVDRGAAHESVRDGATGLVARAGDAISLAAGLALLADDDELRTSLGVAARALACARPSWADVFGDLVAGYRVLGDGRRRAATASAQPA